MQCRSSRRRRQCQFVTTAEGLELGSQRIKERQAGVPTKKKEKERKECMQLCCVSITERCFGRFRQVEKKAAAGRGWGPHLNFLFSLGSVADHPIQTAAFAPPRVLWKLPYQASRSALPHAATREQRSKQGDDGRSMEPCWRLERAPVLPLALCFLPLGLWVGPRPKARPVQRSKAEAEAAKGPCCLAARRDIPLPPPLLALAFFGYIPWLPGLT
jgi:hypothetical protein